MKVAKEMYQSLKTMACWAAVTAEVTATLWVVAAEIQEQQGIENLTKLSVVLH